MFQYRVLCSALSPWLGVELFQHWAIAGALCRVCLEILKKGCEIATYGFQHNYKMINWVLNIMWSHLSSYFISINLLCVSFIFSPIGGQSNHLYWKKLLAYNSVITGFVTSPRMVALSGHDVTRGWWTKSTSESTACAATVWKTRLSTQCLFVLCSAHRHPLCSSLALRPGHVTGVSVLNRSFLTQYNSDNSDHLQQKYSHPYTRNIENNCNHLQCGG